MKTQTLAILIIVAILAFGVITSERGTFRVLSSPGDVGVQIDAVLTRRNFRGAALVIQDGEVILRAAYGMACSTQRIPNTVYSQFHIASVTKSFTGAAILLLESEGELCTSDTLDNFFTGPEGLENVTIAHLLSMQGGFFDYSTWFFLNPSDYDIKEAIAMCVEELEAYIMENMFHGAPQNRPIYCNTDYWLLGRIIEQASGITYNEFVATRLFAPANMVKSGFSGINGAVQPHGLPPAIYVNDINMMDPNNWPFFFSYSTGGLISTVDDLNLWLDAYFGEKFFPAYVLDNVQTGIYNFGWVFEGDYIWHHPGGGMMGYSSQIVYDRESDTRIILLSNHWMGVNQSLTREISEIVLGVPIDGFAVPR